MSTFLLQKNIKHQRTVPYSPQQNGQAERRNQTIMAIARCIMIESGLPYIYWPFAVHYAVYTTNRLPTKRIDWKTPTELWTGSKPNVHHMRTFGCTAFSHIHSSLRSSLQPTSTKCIFLGYAPYHKGYILMDQRTKIIIVRRDVTFNEDEYGWTQSDDANLIEWLWIVWSHSTWRSNYTSENYPKTYREALQRADGDKWHKAAEDELNSHIENNTWSLVQAPSGVNPIKTRWIFTKKRQHDGQEKYKARLVAKGYAQIYGIDFQETYSSVLAQTSLRILITIAVNNEWKLFHRDFTTAYLNAPLTTPIYLSQPDGFVKQGGDKNKVCLLNKAIYGLKQAGRAWQNSLFNCIRSQGYQQSVKEPCLWFKIQEKSSTFIGTYVDDLIMTGSNDREIARMSKHLGDTFKMKDLGELKTFLGIEIIKTDSGVILTQQTYTQAIVKKFGQDHCKPTAIPMSKAYDDHDNGTADSRNNDGDSQGTADAANAH